MSIFTAWKVSLPVPWSTALTDSSYMDSKLVATAQGDVAIFTVPPHERDKHANELAEAKIQELRAGGVRVEVMAEEAGCLPLARVPLERVMQKLGSEGILRLLTETGSRLNTALLAAGLVDRVKLFCSPQIMGSDAVPAFRGLSLPVPLEDAEVERHGNDYSVSALLHDPWAER